MVHEALPVLSLLEQQYWQEAKKHQIVSLLLTPYNQACACHHEVMIVT